MKGKEKKDDGTTEQGIGISDSGEAEYSSKVLNSIYSTSKI